MHVTHMKYTYEICNTYILAISYYYYYNLLSQKVLRTYSFIRGYLFLELYVTSGRFRLAADNSSLLIDSYCILYTLLFWEWKRQGGEDDSHQYY